MGYSAPFSLSRSSRYQGAFQPKVVRRFSTSGRRVLGWWAGRSRPGLRRRPHPRPPLPRARRRRRRRRGLPRLRQPSRSEVPDPDRAERRRRSMGPRPRRPSTDSDTSLIAVAGASVGGWMSTVFALMVKERSGIDLKGQLLLYPVADADFDTPSYIQFAEGYYLTRHAMTWFWDHYSSPEQRTEHHAAPLQSTLEQLQGLTPPWSSRTRPTCCATRARSTPTSCAKPASTSPRCAARHGPRLPAPRRPARHQGRQRRPHALHRLPPRRPHRRRTTRHPEDGARGSQDAWPAGCSGSPRCGGWSSSPAECDVLGPVPEDDQRTQIAHR